jgi:hypothetical protein
VKAVSVLSWLSRLHRKRTGARWLFAFDEIVKFRDETGDREPHFSVYRSLARFALFIELPLSNGQRWVPKPHQFRRLFGCIYYHRYCFAQLTNLSTFFRHFDPDRTRRYVTEAARGSFLRRDEERQAALNIQERRMQQFERERLKDFEAEGHEFRVERMRNVALGLERASGHGGETLTRTLRQLLADAKLKLDLSPADDLPQVTLDSIVTAFVRDKRLEPNGLGHSYCKCTTDPQDLRSAGCLTVREAEIDESSLFSAPDPSFAADYVCSPCPHNVQFSENEPYWLETIAHEELQESCALGPLLRALSAERLKMARGHHVRCFK